VGSLPRPAEIAWKALPGLLLVLAAVAGAGYAFRTPILAVSTGLVARFGLPGVFLGCLVGDSLPAVGAQPVLFLAYTGGLRFLPILAVAALAGIVAGGLCWGLGRLLGRWAPVSGWIQRTGLGPWLEKDAIRTVFASAILPFPFAATAIAAGAAGAPLAHVLLGSTGRAPKALMNLTLIAAGWSLGA
jgi:membrane protein YqaA with SNARE-associated domain